MLSTSPVVNRESGSLSTEYGGSLDSSYSQGYYNGGNRQQCCSGTFNGSYSGTDSHGNSLNIYNETGGSVTIHRNGSGGTTNIRMYR